MGWKLKVSIWQLPNESVKLFMGTRKNNDGHTVMIKVYWGIGFIE